MEASLLVSDDPNHDLACEISNYLPFYMTLFKNKVLNSPVLMRGYYFCYTLLVIFNFVGFIVYAEATRKDFKEHGVLYGVFYILQNISLLLIVPFSIIFLRETLNSVDIPRIVAEAVHYDVGLLWRFRLSTTVTLFGFFISLIAFFAARKNYVTGIISVVLLLLTTLPLPFCVSVIVLLLDSHRVVVNKLSDSVLAGTRYYSMDSVPIRSEGVAEVNRDGSDESALQEEKCEEIIESIERLRREFLRVRGQFGRTTRLRGDFITALSFTLFILLVYLIWTAYLWTDSLYGLLGFIVLVLIIFLQVVLCTAMANDAGKRLPERIAEHILCNLPIKGHGDRDRVTTQFLMCLSFINIEIQGSGGLTVNMKLVCTITVGLVASIVPRLLIGS